MECTFQDSRRGTKQENRTQNREIIIKIIVIIIIIIKKKCYHPMHNKCIGQAKCFFSLHLMACRTECIVYPYASQMFEVSTFITIFFFASGTTPMLLGRE